MGWIRLKRDLCKVVVKGQIWLQVVTGEKATSEREILFCYVGNKRFSSHSGTLQVLVVPKEERNLRVKATTRNEPTLNLLSSS